MIADALWAEKAVLGTVLANPSNLPIVTARLEPDSFYDPQHKQIYMAILDQSASGEPIDFLAVHDRLKPMEFAVIQDLLERRMPQLPEYWIDKIEAASARRRAQGLLQETMDSLGSHDADLTDKLQTMSDEMVKLIAPGKGVGHIADGMVETLKNIEHRETLRLVTTGLKSFDGCVGGLHKGQLWIVAGRTSMGKSSLAQNMILAIASAGHSAGYVSIEGDNDELRQRLLSIKSGVPISSITAGRLSALEVTLVTAASGKLSNMPISYVERERLWSRVKAKIQLLQFEDPKIAVIFVDHIGLIEQPQYKNRWEAIGQVSRDLKGLALSMGVAIVAVCQINRAPEGRKDHRPMLADLRDAGSIEQDADVICLLYRPAYYDKNTDSTVAEINIAKQRNGPTGVVDVAFEPSCIRFSDRS